MTEEELRTQLTKTEFPRASQYDPHWLLGTQMGPNVIWLAEYLSQAMELRPGMRVLDLGCGKAASSIFLAKEFGVTVWAADLWIAPTDNFSRIRTSGVEERVFPFYAEAHALPLPRGYFDAIVSLDAYHYFGTDDLYLGYVSRFLKPDGVLGIVSPGVREEIVTVPQALAPYWEPDFCSLHSSTWWRRHWEKTGLVDVVVADLMPDGGKHWLDWDRICAEFGAETRPGATTREVEMLEKDTDRLLGFVRAVARRR
jgi:cyclopropane fatty-acyl-phospholipid synthase-like methyltransferase